MTKFKITLLALCTIPAAAACGSAWGNPQSTPLPSRWHEVLLGGVSRYIANRASLVRSRRKPAAQLRSGRACASATRPTTFTPLLRHSSACASNSDWIAWLSGPITVAMDAERGDMVMARNANIPACARV